MITRKQILHYTAKSLLTLTGYALRALYAILYVWTPYRYRTWKLNRLHLDIVLAGTARDSWSPTRETDARNREIADAINSGLIFKKGGDVLDAIAKKKFGKVPKDYHLYHPHP